MVMILSKNLLICLLLIALLQAANGKLSRGVARVGVETGMRSLRVLHPEKKSQSGSKSHKKSSSKGDDSEDDESSDDEDDSSDDEEDESDSEKSKSSANKSSSGNSSKSKEDDSEDESSDKDESKSASESKSGSSKPNSASSKSNDDSGSSDDDDDFHGVEEPEVVCRMFEAANNIRYDRRLCEEFAPLKKFLCPDDDEVKDICDEYKPYQNDAVQDAYCKGLFDGRLDDEDREEECTEWCVNFVSADEKDCCDYYDDCRRRLAGGRLMARTNDE